MSEEIENEGLASQELENEAGSDVPSDESETSEVTEEEVKAENSEDSEEELEETIIEIDDDLLLRIVEGALLAAQEPLTINKLLLLFDEKSQPEKEDVEEALLRLKERTVDRGFRLVEVASGWRFQVCEDLAPWVNRLWEEKPQKYSRAILETIALIAYRQPITRGDIEEVRGVSVSSHIIKTLLEREWVKVVGHRDVPGRPSLYATTKQFLDYFGLQSLEDLPTLSELKDIDSLNENFEFNTEEEKKEPSAESESKEAEESVNSEDQQSNNAEDSNESSDLAEESEINDEHAEETGELDVGEGIVNEEAFDEGVVDEGIAVDKIVEEGSVDSNIADESNVEESEMIETLDDEQTNDEQTNEVALTEEGDDGELD